MNAECEWWIRFIVKWFIIWGYKPPSNIHIFFDRFVFTHKDTLDGTLYECRMWMLNELHNEVVYNWKAIKPIKYSHSVVIDLFSLIRILWTWLPRIDRALQTGRTRVGTRVSRCHCFVRSCGLGELTIAVETGTAREPEETLQYLGCRLECEQKSSNISVFSRGSM